MKKNKKSKKESCISTRNFNIILCLVVVLFFLVGYTFLGTKLSLLFSIGVAAILFVARMLDRTKVRKVQRRIMNFLMIFFLILVILGIGGGCLFLGYVVVSAPKFDVKQLNLKESSIIYDKDGNEIRKLGSELRENIEYGDLPQVVVDALIATEDSRFYQHNGFDAARFFKATVGQLAGNSNAGGGSTLSMQVIKNSFTSSTSKGIKGIIRKFTDIYLAVFKLERNFTKEQIIEFYLNNHALGSNSYGIEQASQTYFGKSSSELNLSEAALLIGMYNAPTANNPYLHPENATKRRETVLNLMYRHGYITKEARDIANAIPVESLLAPKSKRTLAYQSYIDTVIVELEEKRGIDPYVTPVLIYTNMDTEKQAKVDAIYNGVSYKWINDVVEGAAAVVEVSTGKIVAIAGGRNKTTELSLNLATKLNNQIGSTAKPIFDYAPGIEYNNWSTYTQFVDEPWTYTNGGNVNNSDRQFMGSISLRTSLSLSRNIPALKAYQQVDKKKIESFVKSLGITPEKGMHEAHSLGSFNGSNPLEMAAAYAAFANGGYYYEPLSVNKIVYRDNGDEEVFKSEKKQVMSDSTAYMITYSLQTSVESGLASGAKVKGIKLAAKTGTTSFTNEIKAQYKMKGDAINDAWIVGYDPEYSIGMWYGYKNLSSEYYSRSTEAVIQRGNIFKAIEKAVMKTNNQDFEVPDSVVKVAVEIGSENPGLLPSENTPEDQITYEYFKKGTEPTEVSTKYQKLENVSNLNVTYSETEKKTSITWSKLNTPTANNEYGRFGYKVYLNDIYLGFTEENSLIVDAPSVIGGVYKVITAFENYELNQSDGATFEFNYSTSGDTTNNGETVETPNTGTTTTPPSTTPTNPTTPSTPTPKPEDTNKYELKLNGETKPIKINQTYNDPGIMLLVNNKPLESFNAYKSSTVTITGPDNKVIETFSGAVKTASFKATQKGTYKISYKVKYAEKELTITREITCTE